MLESPEQVHNSVAVNIVGIQELIPHHVQMDLTRPLTKISRLVNPATMISVVLTALKCIRQFGVALAIDGVQQC